MKGILGGVHDKDFLRRATGVYYFVNKIIDIETETFFISNFEPKGL